MTSRRRFLKQARTGLLTSSAAGMLSSIYMSDALAAPGPDFKALVCVFLAGGNDSHNMVVPTNPIDYATYAASRQALSVPNSQLLPLTPPPGSSETYGFHPNMSGLHNLFESGDLSVVANVGALVQPTTKSDYLSNAVPIPPKLFSHNSQQDYIQSLEAFGAQTTGWASKIADLLQSQLTPSVLPVNLSMTEYNLLQAGGPDSFFTMSSSGPASINARQDPVRAAALDALGSGSSHILGAAEAGIAQRSSELGAYIRSQFNQIGAPASPFSNTRFSQTMRTVAQTINASDLLNMSRQIFFVRVGGWDTHGDQNMNHPTLLSQLSTGMTEFYNEMQLLGIQDQVITFTMSDFGRTLTSNGDGSDHGWGSHQLVMGGGIDGGKIVGTMPDLTIDGPDDIGRGRIVPSQGIDQYGAALAQWLGVADSDLDLAFPNLSNFSSRALSFF